MAQPLQGGDDAFAWPKMHAAPAPDPFQAYPQDVPLSDEELLMLEAQRSPLPLLPSDCRVSGMEGMFGAISPVRGIGPFLSAEERDALMFLLQTDVEENDDGSSSADGLAAAYPSSSSAVSYGCRPAFNQSANDASGSETPQSVDQPIVTLAPKKRRRRRQKEELDFLRVHVVALETQIARLRQKEMDRAYGAAQTGGQLLFMAPMNPPGMWERVANDQLARARAAMLENMHLRAQYEAQLHLVKRLEAMAHNSSCYPIPALSISSMQDDSAVFALLGHDLDAQASDATRIVQGYRS
uniref:Uncharacterized protein n=1 Tax=Globisporangium ultimum (strain ATCC 200006 / CBS 805.95 / DAOM BR144) TaxID=431595 RepID=K3W8Z0_GLOUD